MLSGELKENTKTDHQQLEKKMVACIRSVKTVKDYTNLLGLFYSYFGGLELSINQHLDTTTLPDYATRRKTGALVNDMTAMGASIPALAIGDELPAITSHFEALGALYVIEGSTLGGSIISKMMAQQLQLTGGTGLSFFNGYGDGTMGKWQTFKSVLDDERNAAHRDSIINTANQTFVKFGHFFDRGSLS
jgi:heme oxygenase (biliverdin-IX-beta and delta-forming)